MSDIEEDDDIYDMVGAPAKPDTPVKRTSPRKTPVKKSESDPGVSTEPPKVLSGFDVDHRRHLLQRMSEADGPQNIHKRVREKTMSAICVTGASILTKLPKRRERLIDPIGVRIARYIEHKLVVQIKLRNKSQTDLPNRTIVGRILAADRHWNLLVTDADEGYIPASKMGVVQSYKDQMFEGTVYERVEGQKRLLQRTLDSTIIMGHQIVYISPIR